MFSNKSSDSILSFRDIPPHRTQTNSQSNSTSRLLYKPNYDLHFDLEMAQRRNEEESKGDELTQVSLSYDDETLERDERQIGLESNEVEFGSKVEIENVFDEETLNSLLLPPSPEYTPGFERELRPNAIFLYNRSIGLLKTEQIIHHVLQTVKTRELNFEHLEWIDDFSCVLAFKDKSTAIEAFTTLLLKPDEIEGENGLSEALDYLGCVPNRPSQDILNAAADFVFTLRPSKPLGSDLFDTKKSNPILQPTRPEQLVPFIRFATSLDVKRLRARDHSLFYVLHGDRAGRDGVSTQKASSSFQSSKRRRVHHPSSQRAGPDHEPGSRNRPIARLPSDRRDGRSRHQGAATAADLDDELDRFMCQASSSHDPDGVHDHDEGKLESEDEDLGERRSKRHEAESEEFTKEDLFPRSRFGIGGGNLKDDVIVEEKARERTPAEDGLRTWIVPTDGERDEEGLGEDEEVVNEYVEMIDEETGQKIKRLTQSRRRKSRRGGMKGSGSSFGRLFESSLGRLG